jgi:type III protein arginine methyltransferase
LKSLSIATTRNLIDYENASHSGVMDDADEEDPVTKALRKARYNEIVHISIDASAEDCNENNVRDDNGEHVTTSTADEQNLPVPATTKQSISLIPRLNEHQGGVQFVNLVDCYRELKTDTDEATILLQKELQTKQWFFPMLNDTYRNRCYNEAIRKVIHHVMTHRVNEKNSAVLNVLDIGSGSGLLSLMFAKEFSNYCANEHQYPDKNHRQQLLPQRKVHITSVEMSNAFGTLAQRTLEENSVIHSDPNVHITIHQGQHSTASNFNSNMNNSSDVSSSTGNKHSSGDPPPYIQYDVCISELFEHGLLGEGWIPSLRDAWWRHLSLSPPAIVVPCGANVYGVIVKASWLQHYCRPLHKPYTFTTGKNDPREHHHTLSLDLKNNESGMQQFLIDRCHVVLPIHANKLIRDKEIELVSNTELVFNLKVSSPDSIPTLEGQTSTVTYTIKETSHENDATANDSTSYGVLLWWDMILWEDHANDDSIVYSLQPNEEQPFQDHWCPCLHLLPSDAIDDNSTVDVTFRHDDNRIYVEKLKSHSSKSLLSNAPDNGTLDIEENTRVKRIKTETCNEQRNDSIMALLPPSYISQERAFQLNDRRRIQIFHKALESAILSKRYRLHVTCDESNLSNHSTISPTVTVLDVSDFALGACITASICYSMAMAGDHQFNVISVENSSGHLPILASQVLSNLSHTSDVSNRVVMSVLQCYNENITLDAIDTGTQAVDIVFSEPYYEVLEGWHLQEALNFYYTVRLLRNNGIIDNETIVLPGVCRVIGCIIESPDLRCAYGPCGDSMSGSIHGIQHAYVNRIGRNGRRHDMSMEMWQYDYKILSQTFELGTFQYMDPNAPAIPETTSIFSTFHTHGRCDALMVWLEYSFALPSRTGFDQAFDETVLSTNCQSYSQTIQMLDCCNDVINLLNAQVTCRAKYGGNQFDSHQFEVIIQ